MGLKININSKHGEQTIKHIGGLDKSKDKVYFFDGIGTRELKHPDEKKALQQTYRECTGREIPEKLYTTKAPWYQRQQDVINRPYLKKF